MGLSLKQLAGAVGAVRTEGPLDREVTGLTYDSRRVTPGMVFIAIPGHHADGHDYISSAIDRGAAAVICERNGFASQRATKIKVEDAREALARASAEFFQHPARKLKVIGVTGTNGKTTVAFMVKHLLESAGVRTGLLGTVRYEIGERVIPAQRTTPEALELHQMMAQMVRAGCQACVMEVSSHALDQKRVSNIDFDVGIFTNLTQDHLDYHRTMEEYFAAKRKLFLGIEASSKRGSMVLNVDDSHGSRLSQDFEPRLQLTYGLGEAAQLRAARLELGAERTRMDIETPRGSIACELPLIGRHNIYNALAATGAALALDLPLATVQSALRSMPAVPGRLESIQAGQPFAVFVDYAHTDDALRNVLVTLREITRGRLLLVFGCGGNRDAGKRVRMGRVAAELADFSLITSDNPRRERPDTIAAQIEEGCRSVHTGRHRVELDRRQAIEDILREARPGDTVLLAGKGHETYQEFEDTIVPFDDRVHAREVIEAIVRYPLPSP